MADISLLSASLAAAFIESFFYGVFFVLAITSIYIMLHRELSAKDGPPSRSVLRVLVSSPILGAAMLLFVGLTAHWILEVVRLFQAFVLFEGGTQPTKFYSDLSQRTYVAQIGVLSSCLVICDAIIIYRLWIVWAYNKFIVVVPVCSLTGLAACELGSIIQTSQFRLGDNVDQTSGAAWITPSWAFTICTNVYCSLLIAWKVWREYMAVRKVLGGRKLLGALLTLVESAALYTIWMIFYFVAYECQSGLQFIVNQSEPVICGIACMLISVRVGLGRALETHAKSISISPGMNFASAQWQPGPSESDTTQVPDSDERHVVGFVDVVRASYERSSQGRNIQPCPV